MTPLEKRLGALRPALAAVAQKVYDEWKQDDEGYCDWLGYGGICQDIAEEQAELIYEVLDGVEASTISSTFEQHVFVVVADDEEAVVVDVRPWLYETGGGFCWRKIPGVEFIPEDIDIYSVDRDEFIDEDGEWFEF